MQLPDLPKNELSRLTLLNELRILDTPFEERFDRITRIARTLFDVPIALVSLVDENRQWFKSCFGLSVSETGRDISFCGHAILKHELFVIEDTHQDARFADNPLVTDAPFIRFYAGCPLLLNDQNAMGTLCIIDTKPRRFNQQDGERLAELAKLIELELRNVQLATLDIVTKISNQRGFFDLSRYILNYCDSQTINASLLLVNFANLPALEKEQLSQLHTIANTISTMFRQQDVFARLRLGLFAVLISDCELDEAMILLQALVEKLKAAHIPMLNVQAMSSAYIHNQGTTIEQLLDNAMQNDVQQLC